MPRVMRKELRPVHDLVGCDLCGRTILKGERIETFVAGGDRRKVCELCTFQALRLGWPRESALEEHGLERDRSGPRRSLWARVVEWAEEQGLLGTTGNGAARAGGPPPPRAPSPARDGEVASAEPNGSAGGLESDTRDTENREPRHAEQRRPAQEADGPLPDPAATGGLEEDLAVDEGLGAVARRPGRAPAGAAFKDLIVGRRREPREVHAVPTSREGKIERAFELFNLSEHPRTIAGISRALGEPWVSAAPVGDEPAAREVTIVVAWELSWYRYRVDLDDAEQAVLLLDRGDELDGLEESQRVWNAGADSDGSLALAAEPVS